MHLCYRKKKKPNFPERFRKESEYAETPSLSNLRLNNSINLFTKLQTSVNMNLSQLSENLQCAEIVIQFCQEKNLIGKI